MKTTSNKYNTVKVSFIDENGYKKIKIISKLELQILSPVINFTILK